MAISHSMMINNELLNKDIDLIPEKLPLIILDSRSYVCMANNCKYTKHNRQISRRIHVVRNFEECNLHKKVWCEVGIQLAYNETKNVRGGLI